MRVSLVFTAGRRALKAACDPGTVALSEGPQLGAKTTIQDPEGLTGPPGEHCRIPGSFACLTRPSGGSAALSYRPLIMVCCPPQRQVKPGLQVFIWPGWLLLVLLVLERTTGTSLIHQRLLVSILT